MTSLFWFCVGFMFAMGVVIMTPFFKEVFFDELINTFKRIKIRQETILLQAELEAHKRAVGMIRTWEKQADAKKKEAREEVVIKDVPEIPGRMVSNGNGGFDYINA